MTKTQKTVKRARKPARKRRPRTPADLRALQRQRADECRKFIVESVVNKKQSLEISKVAKQFSRSESAIRNDLSKYFWPNRIAVNVRRNQLIFDQGHLTTEGRRRSENPTEKARIGVLGARLITGTSRVGANDDEAELTKGIENPAEDDLPMSTRLRETLSGYFRKAHRLAILDSGTTNVEIAKELADVHTPSPDLRLNFLRILTNGRRVAETLDSPGSTHGIILLGGELRRDTEAVAGLLGVRCLESWLVNTEDPAIADIAIIGTTSVNTGFDLFSDSEIESEMKSRLLNAARIRCICADSSKLMRRSGGTWAFSAFTNRMIDIVLTDAGILVKHPNPAWEEARTKFLDRAREKEIFVAVAK
jgi:DeoR/GlpR family transcriptional regulator of sugar metabolism